MNIKRFIFNPIQENTYVVYDDTHEAVVIDAGCNSDTENHVLANFIDEQKLVIKHLLCTHLHLDHQFGNRFISERYKVSLEADEGDAHTIRLIPAQAQLFGIPLYAEPIPVSHYLTDGDKINFGHTILEVLHTPGHSKGGICFWCATEKCIFVGDTLFQGSIGRTDLPGGNQTELIKSIHTKLLTLPDDTVVYCGHGPSTTIGDEKQMNPYL